MSSQAVGMKKFVAFGIAILIFLAGCAGITSQVANNPPSPAAGSNPAPAITTISPNSALAGGADFTLTINGTNFVAVSVVNFGGTARATSFIGFNQLTATIPAAAIAAVGNAAVTVTNPAAGGGASNAVNFTITNGTNPIPIISSLTPAGAPPVGMGFSLVVTGSNFVAGSVVRWNGSDRPTIVLAATSVEAQIPGTDVAVAGTATITVVNPAPGGGGSNALNFDIAAGAFPQSIAVDPTGKFAYVANAGFADDFPGSVSMYTIDLTTGSLTSIGSVPADFGTVSVTVDPSGKFVYAANDGGFDVLPGSVSMYTINPTTGVLMSKGTIQSPCAPPPSPGSCSPLSVAVSPSGKFAYAANEGGFSPTSVSMYTVDATTGALTFSGIAAAGGRAVSATVDPTGKFAYATDGSNGIPGESDNVSMFTIDTTTGALTLSGTIAAGSSPTSLAIDPLGKFAYVTNSGANNVSMYTINGTTGALTSIGPVAAGTAPVSAAVDPTGKFAYVANSGSNDVSMYTINTATGALTFTGTIAAGSSPSSIAIHPSGKFAYVTNSGSNNVSMYSINTTTGALTLLGTVGT